MSNILTFELPIYINEFNNTRLLGLNWYRNSHYCENNKIKGKYKQLIFSKLYEAKNSFKKYSISYNLYYKHNDIK